MRGVLLVIGAIAVAAIVIFSGIFTKTLPNVNDPNANSIGYVDLVVHNTWDLDKSKLDNSLGCNSPTAFCPLAPVGIRLEGNEHITKASQSPATLFQLPRLTAGGATCEGFVKVTVVGPGISAPILAQSDKIEFILGDVVAYHFGHLYLDSKGDFTVKMEWVINGCYTYNSQTVYTLSKPLTFDGVSDN
jgi:hypothetical protein